VLHVHHWVDPLTFSSAASKLDSSPIVMPSALVTAPPKLRWGDGQGSSVWVFEGWWKRSKHRTQRNRKKDQIGRGIIAPSDSSQPLLLRRGKIVYYVCSDEDYRIVGRSSGGPRSHQNIWANLLKKLMRWGGKRQWPRRLQLVGVGGSQSRTHLLPFCRIEGSKTPKDTNKNPRIWYRDAEGQNQNKEAHGQSHDIFIYYIV